VYDLACHGRGCQGRVPYNGSSEGVLNMGSFLITHFVLYDYMLHFLYGRCSLYRYYLVLRDRHMRKDTSLAPEYKEIVTYNHFRSSWYHYIDHLDIDLLEGFTCHTPRTGIDIKWRPVRPPLGFTQRPKNLPNLLTGN
jgi:hypothetical protein